MYNRNKIKFHPTKIRTITEELYSISSLLYEYCQQHNEVEEINTITPLVKILASNTDELNAYFINKCK